ncbi:hypothetical protein FV219_28045, partial [Methylobacterium sp. WL122]
FHLVGIAGSNPPKDFLVQAYAAGADDVVSKSDAEVLAPATVSISRGRARVRSDSRSWRVSSSPFMPGRW